MHHLVKATMFRKFLLTGRLPLSLLAAYLGPVSGGYKAGGGPGGGQSGLLI